MGESLAAESSVAAPDAVVEREIELCLAPEQATLLARRPGLQREGNGRVAKLIWYDDSEASLARQNLILERGAGGWELQALGPDELRSWPAAEPTPLIGRAASPGELDPTPPLDAAPVAAFEGRRRQYRGDGLALEVTSGTLRGLLESKPACRVRLRGPAAALQSAVAGLADLAVAVPRASLAREALAVARGEHVPARHLGAPALSARLSVSEGLASLLGDLLDTLLHWADRFRAAPVPQAVHQGRVATRRLRSALALYKSAASCPELADLGEALRDCAARLGAARDWDVFLAGTGARLADATDGRVAALLRAARRRRDVVYADLGGYLGSAAFRRLELGLALAASLRPWEQEAAEAELGAPTPSFAVSVLERRLKKVRRRGRHLEELELAELHELRKDCKKLRYAAEFFAPALHAGHAKPMLKRLAALQEELGLLNDSVTASHLMGQLGRIGSGFAGGLVEGWAAAEAMPARGRVSEEWKKFKSLTPFWTR